MSKSEWLEFCKGTHTKNAYINVFFIPASQVFYTGWWVYILYRANDINQKIKISIQPKNKLEWDLLNQFLELAGMRQIDTFKQLEKDLRSICKNRKNYNPKLPNTWIKCKIKCNNFTDKIESLEEIIK